MIKKIGFGIAAVAAVSFAMMSPSAMANTAHHSSKNVKCYGGNSCKGKSACKNANNSCKGKNDCKNKGVAMVSSKSACEKLGGTTQKPSSSSSSDTSNTSNTTNTANPPVTGTQPTTQNQ